MLNSTVLCIVGGAARNDRSHSPAACRRLGAWRLSRVKRLCGTRAATTTRLFLCTAAAAVGVGHDESRTLPNWPRPVDPVWRETRYRGLLASVQLVRNRSCLVGDSLAGARLGRGVQQAIANNCSRGAGTRAPAIIRPQSAIGEELVRSQRPGFAAPSSPARCAR